MAEKIKEKKWQVFAKRLVQGRKRDYTLEELQQEFLAFVDYYTHNPVISKRIKQRQKGASKDKKPEVDMQGDQIEHTAPMTEYAFCCWIGKSRSWFPQTIVDLKKKKSFDADDEQYLQFLERIHTFFQSQLLEGAIVGEYSPQIICSLLGLKDGIDITSGGKPTAAPVINLVADHKTREDYDTTKG